MKEVESLLRKNGYQILARNARESIVIKIDDHDHFSNISADLLVLKGKQEYPVLIIKDLKDPLDPILRARLIELQRSFLSQGVILVDPEKLSLTRVGYKFPKEKNLEYYFNFALAMFIVLIIVFMVWLMTAIKLL